MTKRTTHARKTRRMEDIRQCIKKTSAIQYNAKKHFPMGASVVNYLKGPWSFSVPSKLLILYGETKSYCFTVSCVPESICNYLQFFHSDFLRFDMFRIKYNSQTLACKQEQRCG